MTRLLGCGKHILAFVIAFAVLAVSLFTGIGITANAASTVSEYTGTPDATLDGKGTADEPYIIKTADEFAAVALGYVKSDNNTYFKVADGINAFYINGGKTVADMTTTAEVKNHFTANGGHIWTNPSASSVQQFFMGNFDGNGVTVYGLYTGSTALGSVQGCAALFPKTGAGAVIKNVAVKNSYIEGGYWAGGIVARGNDTDNKYTSDQNNKLTLENVEVVNNVIICNNGYTKYGGIVYANTEYYAAFVTNCVAYGNDASYSTLTSEMPLFSYSEAQNSDGISYNKFINIVSFGHSLNGSNWATKAVDNGMYQNVYSDKIDKNQNYNDRNSAIYNLNPVTPEQMTGATAIETVAACVAASKQTRPNDSVAVDFDWENVWFATTGYPTLRALHDIKTFVCDDAFDGHYIGCECGIVGSTGIQKHTFNKDNICEGCGFECHHTDLAHMTEEEVKGDCVTDTGVKYICECGHEDFVVDAAATGHKLVHHDGVASDCLHTGTLEHWICEECNNIFLTDDIMTPMADAVTEDELVTDIGGHTQTTDTEGKVAIYNNETGHWYECSVCDGILDHDSGEIEEVIEHDYEDSVCVDCGWECTDHDYQPTGVVIQLGDCFTDRKDELKCSICGTTAAQITYATHTIVKVDEVAATDKLEGTKAHYQCEICNSIFADAEGKTPIDKASLVIAKTLPEGYGITVLQPEASELNTDSSSKSPSTGESIALTIAAVALLAGAAAMIIRKIKKA